MSTKYLFRVGRQILMWLDWLDYKNLLYGDLKMYNIFVFQVVTEPPVKIAYGL